MRTETLDLHDPNEFRPEKGQLVIFRPKSYEHSCCGIFTYESNQGSSAVFWVAPDAVFPASEVAVWSSLPKLKMGLS